jgi:hypothetical protein
MAWTYVDREGLLEHITVREKYRDGVLSIIQLLAHENYAIYDTTQVCPIDPETNEPFPPIYSYQVSMGANMDYTRFRAVPIEDGMIVAGAPNEPEHEIA